MRMPLSAFALLSAEVSRVSSGAASSGPCTASGAAPARRYALDAHYSGDNMDRAFLLYRLLKNGNAISQPLDWQEAYDAGIASGDGGSFNLTAGGRGGARGLAMCANTGVDWGLIVIELSHLPETDCAADTKLTTMHQKSSYISMYSAVGDDNESREIVSFAHAKQPRYLGCRSTTEGFPRPAGGGVFAMQWSRSVVRQWAWSGADVPADALSGSPRPDAWEAAAELTASEACGLQDFHTPMVEFWVSLCTELRPARFYGCLAARDPAFRFEVRWTPGSPGWYFEALNTCRRYVRENAARYRDMYWGIKSIRVFQEVSK